MRAGPNLRGIYAQTRPPAAMDTPQRTRPDTPSDAAPAKAAGPGGTCGMKMLTAVLGILVMLITIVVAYSLYRTRRSRRIGPPADCSDYPSGPLTFMCKTGLDACKGLDGRDRDACDAAVGACMPVARAAYDHWRLGGGEDVASLFNRIAPHVPDCAEAAYKISPAGAAKAFDSLGIPVSLPPELAPFYKDAETRANVQSLAGLVPDAVKWSLDFGKSLPVKGSFAPGPTQRRDPLCPRDSQSQCYDDRGCGPAGSCQSYSADDPTYGGQWAPA